MNWEITLAVIAFVAVPVGVVGGTLFLKIIERDLDKEAAIKFRTPVLMVISSLIIATFLSSFIASILSIPITFEGLTDWFLLLITLGAFVILVFQQKWYRSNHILYDLSNGKRNPNAIIVAIIIFAAVKNIFKFHIIEDEDVYAALITIVLSLMFAYGLVSMFTTVYLTEEGFSRYAGKVAKWEQITEYEWHGRKKDKIRLNNNGRTIATYSVPNRNRERLNEILQTRIGQHMPAEIKDKVVYS